MSDMEPSRPSADDLVRFAQGNSDRMRVASRRLGQELDAVSTLFGRPLGEHLRESVDGVTEHASEGHHHYAEAVKEQDRTIQMLRSEARELRGALTYERIKAAPIVERAAKRKSETDRAAAAEYLAVVEAGPSTSPLMIASEPF